MKILDKHIFVLGSAKAGTTFLHTLLDQHYYINMSNPKEPFFFEAEYENGLGFYLEKYFNYNSKILLKGDSRHRNLVLPFVPKRIEQSVKEPRFIVLVRDPVNRAFSHWWHWYSRGIEQKSFQEIVEFGINGEEFHGLSGKELEEEYVRSLNKNGRIGYTKFEAYIESSLYSKHIKKYQKLFGKERVFVVFQEDLKENPQKVMTNIFDFLGLDSEVNINIDCGNKNYAVNPVTQKAFYVASKYGLSRLGPFGLRKIAKKMLKKAKNSSYNREKLNNNYICEMRLRKFFKNDIEVLENITGRNLENWKK